MKILATLADASACGYYRVAIPLTELNMAHGHETAITMLMPMDPHDPLYDVDVFVIQRVVHDEIADFVTGPLRAAHPDLKIIYELDDLVTDLHPTNEQAWAYYAADGRLEVFKELIAACDGVTTTTVTLAQELSELNPNVHVLPNRLPNWAGGLTHNDATDYDLYDVVTKSKRKVQIVYTGGPSHVIDVQNLSYGIGRTINQLGDKVGFTSYGHPWITDLGIKERPGVQYRPWTFDFPAYQASLVGYDIGIAPLRDNRFNRSKSAIKVYEYWAAGVVPVVSDVQPYAEEIEHGVDGFLCRTDNDWRKAIVELSEDTDRLKEMREAGYKRVPDLLISSEAHRWAEVYES